MKKYIIVLVIICFGFTQKNNAQVINYEGETIFVHINATTFVTGENLLYKIYCLNNNSKQLSEISKIAYIEIIDDNNNVILRNKIALNKGVASNEFFISTNFNTGNYKLIAYTNWMLNNVNSKYFEADISIINPFLPTNNKQISSNEIDPSVTIKTSNSDKKNNDISLNFTKKIFSKREKLELDITSNSEKFIGGNFSISIRKIDALTFNQATNSIDFINNNNTDKFINLENISFLPELRGELLSGKITTNDSEKSVKDKHIALSITGSPFDLKIVKTNNNGEFNFILDKDLMKKEGILQILENDINNFQIILNRPSKVEYKTSSSKNNISFSENLIKDIEDRLVACQIVNAYSSKDSLSIKQSTSIPFYGYNAKEYILDDYKRFPTFKETIIEIVPAVYFKENKDNYTLHIRDFITEGESFGNALVLIDGLLLQDVNELFNYSTNNIYKISVVNKAYSYGSKLFSGVISITTFNREYTPKSKNILTIQIERCNEIKTYQPLLYDSGKDLTRFPDFRYQLAWDDNVKIATPFHFYTSDIEGKFEISLEGFSSKGEPVSIKEYFEVK
jgi:hypothetical protein